MQRAYDEARRLWPDVDWTETAYARHVAVRRPAYPTDLFLAGAAGHRVDAAWRAIQFELGARVVKLLGRLPRADFSPEELWAETLTRVMADDPSAELLDNGRRPAVIHRYRGAIPLVNYLMVVARRLAIERRRRMRPSVSMDDSAARLLTDLVDTRRPSPESAVRQMELETRMRAILLAAFGTLSPERQRLLAMVYRDGLKQNVAGARLGWSEFKTSRELAAAIRAMRAAVVDLRAIRWTASAVSVWEACWADCWKRQT
jgi:DNA-directed RNA polymerase specialized sigma24 family protein